MLSDNTFFRLWQGRNFPSETYTCFEANAAPALQRKRVLTTGSYTAVQF
jgi:hypothetical protein